VRVSGVMYSNFSFIINLTAVPRGFLYFVFLRLLARLSCVHQIQMSPSLPFRRLIPLSQVGQYVV
jgi:hypothetical protein